MSMWLVNTTFKLGPSSRALTPIAACTYTACTYTASHIGYYKCTVSDDILDIGIFLLPDISIKISHQKSHIGQTLLQTAYKHVEMSYTSTSLNSKMLLTQ